MRTVRVGMLVLAAMAACHPAAPDRAHVETLFGLDANRRPFPEAPAAVVAFGAALFTQRLGAAACADCHPRERHGQDGQVHHRDTPALADVARQSLFGRDGLVPTLPAMVERELANRHALVDDARLQAAVAADPVLRTRSAAAQPGAVPTLARAADAIAAYLATWRSRGRWDRYVEGDDAALTAAERAGVATFVEVGCAICHGGRNLGGGSVHRLGLVVPFAAADRGREAATGKAADRDLWRAPMLRHAVHTAPYLHDGSVADLAATVRLMGVHELGRELSEPQVHAIATMLRAVGDVDVDALAPRHGLAAGATHGR